MGELLHGDGRWVDYRKTGERMTYRTETDSGWTTARRRTLGGLPQDRWWVDYRKTCEMMTYRRMVGKTCEMMRVDRTKTNTTHTSNSHAAIDVLSAEILSESI